MRRTIGGLGLRQVRFGRVLVLTLCCAVLPLAARALLPASFVKGPLGSAVVLAMLPIAFAPAAQRLKLFDLRAFLRVGRRRRPGSAQAAKKHDGDDDE